MYEDILRFGDIHGATMYPPCAAAATQLPAAAR